MASPRRIGAPDSKTRGQLLDAAEQLILDEGYAAATSRRVAAKAGLKPQLVHYYFRTMDDLFIEVYRRRAEQSLERYERALGSDRPLHAIWAIATDPRGTAFTMEFAALAHHRKAIRAEIARTDRRYRELSLDAVTAVLERAGVPPDVCPPIALLLGMTGISFVLVHERALGITEGHAETVALVERYLDLLEQEPART
jgi:AcrR family transcriptional regulator